MSTSILKKVLPLEETPGFPEAFAKAVYDHRNTVCSVCGLNKFGHGPESEWLGFESHRYESIPADKDMLDNAERLTTQAYRNRRTQIENKGE